MEEHTIYVLSCFNIKLTRLCIANSKIKEILDLLKFTNLLSLKCYGNYPTMIICQII